MYFPMSDIIPVFLGADLNCYNFARAFHEAYGVQPGDGLWLDEANRVRIW